MQTSDSHSPVSIEETARWYDGKQFHTDWTSWHFPNWMTLLAPFRDRPARMLEIGSWEGRSAIFFLNYLPQVQIDLRRYLCRRPGAPGGRRENRRRSRDAGRRRGAFRCQYQCRFQTRSKRSRRHRWTAWFELGLADRRFDIAYIDGGHRAREVYADSALTWPLMAPGGLVIFDDYQWAEMPDPMDNPKPGVDAFLKSIEGQYRMVHNDYQVAIAKL